MRLAYIFIQAILFFFLFVILLSLFNISSLISFLYSKVEITLYLKDGLSSFSKEALMKDINKLRDLAEIRYQSKEEALKGLVSAEVANLLDKNPLCDSFKIRLLGKIEPKDFEKFIFFLTRLKDIEKISFSKETVRLLSKIKDRLLKGLLFLCGIYLFGLVIILFLLCLIEVRLDKEREILYLSGRSKWSLCLSSIISAMIKGLISGGIALSFLFLGYTFFIKRLSFFGFQIAFFSPDIILSLLGIGVILGFLAKLPSLFFI